MKKSCIAFIAVILFNFMLVQFVCAKDYVINTKNSMLYFSGEEGKPLLFRYFGLKINDIESLKNSATLLSQEAYPAFGIDCVNEKALHVTHADGNMSVLLHLKSYQKTELDKNVVVHKFLLEDPKYPFYVTLFCKSYLATDIYEIWTEISHQEKGQVTLHKFASFQMPINATEYWLSHFNGTWGSENGLVEEKLEMGMKVIKNREGIRNTQTANSAFMLSLDGEPSECQGRVIAGALAYTGNYKVSFDNNLKGLSFIAGINEDASQYYLKKGEVFETPKFILTYSNSGKGQVSRNIHQWAREYKILDGNKERMVLLNSWEGVYFKTHEKPMLDMIDDIASLGGELFVMDDGWFGDKYPRNNGKTSLGDWVVDKSKLPNGLQPLIERAKANNIKFGIWLEPEMTNDMSELFEKHPEWVISQPNRETVKGRGGSQMTLDLSNPQVQDFVYNTIHELLQNYPEIAYIKWDANHLISNYGSNYLPKDKQSHLYIEYHRGLINTLERIRKKHPDIVMQVCASGGGRVSYGHLPYFHEFWTSDNTDALTRIYMQWGVSHFFPAITMASHVSANKNHQTGRMLPLKFRFDVAMTGRLGLEMQPKDLTDEEKVFAKSAISTYKTIRPIIQFGDLYRLESPYNKNGMASLMYTSKDKSKAVLFAFVTDTWQGRISSKPIQLKGLESNKKYMLTEINKQDDKSQLLPNSKIVSGEVLMSAGVMINFVTQYSSAVVLIEVVSEN